MGDDHDSRALMVAGAADMIGRRGPGATSVRELAKHAGAPLGSTYHYFPGGKAQLAAEAVQWTEARVMAALALPDASDPAAVVAAFLDYWQTILLDSDFRLGCPVLAVAVADLPGDDAAPRDAAVFAFSHWTAVLAASMRTGGATHTASADTAVLVVAAVEGAVAMCRAERTLQPLHAVGRQLRALLL